MTKEETQKEEIKIFTLDLRRVLYLMQILKYNLVSLKKDSVTPGFIKANCASTIDAIESFKYNLNTNPSMSALIEEDLGKDQLHDIANLLDLVSNLKDVDQINKVIVETIKRDNVTSLE